MERDGFVAIVSLNVAGEQSQMSLQANNAPLDFGPIYAETDMSRFPVEPWNTLSNFAFLVIVIYWTIKLRKDWRSHPLLSMSIPIIFLGFVGGTIYHATRSNSVWLLLDYLPIMILILAAAVFMWKDVLHSWWLTFFATMLLPTTYRLMTMRFEVPEGVFITAGYGVLALGVCIPACLHCAIMNKSGAKWLALSAVSFACAIVFRQFDWKFAESGVLPQGGHFLWHLFGAVSAFFLMQYLYLCPKIDTDKN